MIMTANEARKITKNLNYNMLIYLDEVENKIREACEKGERHISYGRGEHSYKANIKQVLEEAGYEVHHITAPHDELEIYW